MTDMKSHTLAERPPAVVGDITVGGDLSGLAAIGDNIVQMHIGRLGNLVTPTPGPPVIERRPAPVLALGRRPQRFVDRESETAAGVAAARAGEVVEFVGPDGAGKSTLLRELAHRLADDARRGDRAAVVLLDASNQPFEDVLQELFGLLHQTDRPYLPTGGELRTHLQGWHAVVLVDDLSERDDLRRLMDDLPDSGLVLTTGQGHDIGDILPLPLRGLPADAAAALVRAPGAPGAPPAPAEEERAVAELVQRLDGRPGALAAVAAGVGMGSTPLPALSAAADPRVASYEALPGAARRVLRLLAAVPGLALTAQEASAAIAEPAQTVLVALVERGLVDEVGGRSPTPGLSSQVTPDGASRYRATASTAQLVRAQADLAAEEQALLTVFDDRLHGTPAAVVTSREAHAARLVLLAASGRGRWREVLCVGRAIEGVLALTGSWGSWRQVLTAMLAAARRLHDTEAESFALHQLGSRALCLGQLDEADRLLSEALQLRRDAHDVRGAEVTEHNLRLLTATPVPPDTGTGSGVRRALRLSHRSLLLAVLAAVALLVLAALVIRSSLAGPGTSTADPDPPAGSTASWQLTPKTLEFGELPMRRTVERSLSVTSSGDRVTPVREVSVAGPDAADFRVLRNDCAQAPPAGQACEVAVAFTPAAEGGREARLQLLGEDGRSASVPLQGRGTAGSGAVGDITPTILDFGRVTLGTTAGPRPVTVTNSGDAPLVLGNVSVEGRDAEEFQIDDRCPERLAPGDGCEVLVRFAPDAAGARIATLTGGPDGEVSVPLTGTGFRVVDETGPVIAVADVVAEATSPDGAVVELAATASDGINGVVDVDCQPGDGQFPLGTTPVTCRAVDRSDNGTEKTVDVTVLDTTPPLLDLPRPDPAEAQSLAGTAVDYGQPTARDAVDGEVPVDCSPASGSVFPIGSTTVRCSAADEGGRSTTETFEAEVRDTTPPTFVTLPKDVVTYTERQVPVEYDLPEAEDLGEPAEVTCDPRSESPFPVGVTKVTVTCTADDGRGNTSPAVSFTVSVEPGLD